MKESLFLSDAALQGDKVYRLTGWDNDNISIELSRMVINQDNAKNTFFQPDLEYRVEEDDDAISNSFSL